MLNEVKFSSILLSSTDILRVGILRVLDHTWFVAALASLSDFSMTRLINSKKLPLHHDRIFF